MGNRLDEMDGEILEEGREVNVINKSIAVELEPKDKFPIYGIYGISCIVALIAILTKHYLVALLAVIPPVWLFINMKNINSYFFQLEQKMQQLASEIDNYQEQRVIILENAASILEKAIDLDKSAFTDIAKYRSGNINDESRNQTAGAIDQVSRQINVALENYPDLKAHHSIMDAMQQNSYLQREVTAARSNYNDAIYLWNREIFEYPFKKIVAAEKGYKTRIPFASSQNIKTKSEGVFF